MVSSTNFILRFHERNKLFVMIVNKMTPNLVPCGIPPLGVFHSDIMMAALMRLPKQAAEAEKLVSVYCLLLQANGKIFLSFSGYFC